MKSKNIKTSPFTKCLNGHSTTTEKDYIYDNMNRRKCRKCVEDENKNKKRR